jgi:hypothetical protein
VWLLRLHREVPSHPLKRIETEKEKITKCDLVSQYRQYCNKAT